MDNKDGVWTEEEVKGFVCEHLCNSKTGEFDFKPLLLNTHRETPQSPKLAEAVSLMREQGYVEVNKPNYDHYWVKLNGSGKRMCKEFKG